MLHGNCRDYLGFFFLLNDATFPKDLRTVSCDLFFLLFPVVATFISVAWERRLPEARSLPSLKSLCLYFFWYEKNPRAGAIPAYNPNILTSLEKMM